VFQWPSAESWLTFGLLVFAGVQLWLQYVAEATRKSEREHDEQLRAMRAVQLVWAEHFRVDAFADWLASSSVLELASLRVLRAEDVLPNDWTRLVEALTVISTESGYLGGVALTQCRNLERDIAVYLADIDATLETCPGGTLVDRQKWLRDHYDEKLARQEESIRRNARQLALLYWDALSQGPHSSRNLNLQFSPELKSDFAKAAVAAIATRSSTP